MTVLTIERSDYYTREQPEKSEEMVNRVEVVTQPLQPETDLSTVYTSKEITVAGSGSHTLTAEYASPPVLVEDAVASIIDNTGGTITVLSSTFYPWGGEIVIENNTATEGTAKVKIEGYALKVQGKETVTAEDTASIGDNGLSKYTYPDNHLIQSPEMAQLIADTLLASYKLYRKDVNINWRGNPSLELGDDILVTVYERGATKVQQEFRVYKNQIEYNGSINQITDGRKI